VTAIPTTYAGVNFRSRIEARWACFFDKIGWPWTYEPYDLEGYIPDFTLDFYKPLLVEVKHDGADVAEAKAKIEASGWAGEALVVCGTWPRNNGEYPYEDQHAVGELLEVHEYEGTREEYEQALANYREYEQARAERKSKEPARDKPPSRWAGVKPSMPRWRDPTWGNAMLFRCKKCGGASLLHDELSWRCRVNGCYDGNRYIREALNNAALLWREAGNETQWKSPRHHYGRRR
jgi:hypothetical protein